ncbi:hypothetical protein A3K86_04455 [Photobacterium jeanii]|uniref:Uncharacterized protein n=1 Tax=Photobacterium jeanii TaxID=858640 RepID=A0A178KLL2_9GAMM|nr:ABZJ_00895 family protein [Photobacterium jeanii]OAN18157.1 hypothetical protein A3K86_04455 [Photobacterium jeanii]PST92167.1 hypothetical protein C9I91_03020 [Photobacterium jeanii]
MYEFESELKGDFFEPSWVKVGLSLFGVSLLFGFLLGIVEGLIFENTDSEPSSLGILATLLPTMIVGYFCGYQKGALMQSITRLKAIGLSFFISLMLTLLLVIFVMAMMGESITLSAEVVLIAGVAIIFSAFMFAVQYFVMWSFEKVGSRTRKLNDEKKAKSVDKVSA